MRVEALFRTALLSSDPDVRDRVRPLLAADPELVLVEGTVGSPGEVLREQQPQLAFFDAEDRAFELLQDGAERPALHPIFLARNERHAARAFDVGAVDYVLAPYAAERVRSAVERFKQRIRAERLELLNRQLSAVLGQLQKDRSPAPHAAYLDRIPIKEHDLVRFMPVDELVWVEAAGNYVLLHTRERSHMLLETMRDLEARLDPSRFLRIHRSRIVNLDYVEALSPMPYGEYRVHLRSGREITSSRSRSAALADALGL